MWTEIKFQWHSCSKRIEWRSQFKASNPSFFVDLTYILIFVRFLFLFIYSAFFPFILLSTECFYCQVHIIVLMHFSLFIDYTKSYISVVSVFQHLYVVLSAQFSILSYKVNVPFKINLLYALATFFTTSLACLPVTCVHCGRRSSEKH